MRVLRLSAFVAATAIIAAACGDKVQVTQQAPPGASIQGVVVAPASATISVGQDVFLSAAVNATAGLSYTVTWTTSSSAAATVSQANPADVHGVASSAGVAICAQASASGANSVTACATVVVQPAAQVTPAVIQIASITTQAGGLNFPVPIPPAAVAGQINVSVNMNPGTEKMDSVVVYATYGAGAPIPAAKQSFSSAQAAALRSATTDAAGDQALQSTLVFPINTAAFNNGPSCLLVPPVAPCGAVTFPNGSVTISAVGYGKQGTAPAGQITASQGVALLFGNADAWIVMQTYGAGTGSGTSAAGFTFKGGPTASVTVTAVPVLYSGLAIASANINYGTGGATGCDASLAAQRTLAATAPVGPSVAWTAVFARTATGATGVGNVNNYEFFNNPASPFINGVSGPTFCSAAFAAGGEGATIASSLYTTNTTGPTALAAGSTIPVVRLDNRAPVAPTLMQNPRIRENGWINAAVGILALNAGPTSNNSVVAGVGDAGVGGTFYQLRVAPPGAGNIVDPARLATPLTAATAIIGAGTLAPTLTSSGLCGIWTAVDALGNESAIPAAGTVCSATALAPNTALASNNMLFGVDIAPPTITMSAGSIVASVAGAGNTGANVGGEFQVTVLDTGIIGNSGMLVTAAPMLATVTIRTMAAGLSAAALCPVGSVVGGVCTASSVGFAPPTFPFVTTNVIAAQTVIGYYTFTAQDVDAAGNVSTNIVSRVVDYNPAANIPTLTASTYSTPLNGPTATFTATGSSGNTTVNGPNTYFDLWKVSYNLAYAGGLFGPLAYPTTTIQTFNTIPFMNNAVPISISIAGFIRQIENANSTCNVALTTGGLFKPSGLNETLLDMVSNSSGNVNTPILGASVAAGVSYLGTAPASQQIFAFIDANGVSENPTIGGCPSGPGSTSVVKVSIGGTSADPTSVTLKADVFGPTALFNPPFAQVNFYVQVGANLELIGTTTTYATTDDGSAQGRKHSYTLSWTPGATSPISGTTWAAAGFPGQSSAACAPQTVTNFQIYAVGVSAAGDGLVTLVNQNICDSNRP